MERGAGRGRGVLIFVAGKPAARLLRSGIGRAGGDGTVEAGQGCGQGAGAFRIFRGGIPFVVKAADDRSFDGGAER